MNLFKYKKHSMFRYKKNVMTSFLLVHPKTQQQSFRTYFKSFLIYYNTI